VAGASGTTDYGLRPNNDSGANYRRQWVLGEGTTVTAGELNNANRIFLLDSTGSGQVGSARIQLWAKSGKVRTVISDYGYRITSSDVGRHATCSQFWNNTTDNIISLAFVASQTNGFAPDTHVCVYKKV